MKDKKLGIARKFPLIASASNDFSFEINVGNNYLIALEIKNGRG